LEVLFKGYHAKQRARSRFISGIDFCRHDLESLAQPRSEHAGVFARSEVGTGGSRLETPSADD